MILHKTELFLKAYQSKEEQRKCGLQSKFVFLCSQLMLEPVYDGGRWRAYVTDDILIEMLQDESLWLIDFKYRINNVGDKYPVWIKRCPECCHHIPQVVFHSRLKLSPDLVALLEQVGEYLDGAPGDIPVPDDTHFRWIAKQHNGHLTLGEMLFGPKHGYYDLYSGLFRKLKHIFSRKVA